MTSLTLDAGTLARFQNLGEIMEIRDESGHVVGYFHPVESTSNPRSGAQSPFSDDELRRRQQQRTGKPLADVLAKLSSS